MSDLLQAAGETWLRQAIAFGPLFVLGALLFFVQRWTQTNIVRVIGWRGLVYWTGWIGTPIHEASHWLIGKVFAVRILEVRLFSPDPESGVLGYVRYRIPRLRLVELPQIVGTFMMGIAPLFGGTLALLALRLVLVDEIADAPFLNAANRFAANLPSASLETLVDDFGTLVYESYRPLFEGRASDVWLWVYVYLSLAIGTHLAPSTADLKGGVRGFLAVAVLVFIANVVALALGADVASATGDLGRVLAPMATLLAFGLALNVGHGAVAFLLARVRRFI